MCGIAGSYSRSDPRPVARERTQAMIRTLHHRGPDGDGFHEEPHIGFGFCRLAIIDLATGQQPLCNEDKTIWLVFNGEIYNYKELAETLRNKGHFFRSQGDSETIVHAYEEWGDACVEHLRGIFAFAIWERKKKRLFMARDRSGVKPLYFTETKDGLVFASEMKALLADQPQTRALDLVGYTLRDPLGATTEMTLCKNVRALAPGCTAVADADGFSVRRYWDYLPSHDGGHSQGDPVAEFRQRLQASVNEQVMSEVPIGAYLSGGIDSAAVVAAMIRSGVSEFQTLTTVNRFVGDDELFAKKCVEALKLKRALYFEYDQRAQWVQLFPLIAWMAEGEFDAGYVTRYQLARYAAAHGIKVVLTGQGIDEILTGYYPSFDAFVNARANAHLSRIGGISFRGTPPWRNERLPEIFQDAGNDLTGETVLGLREMHQGLSRGLLRFEDRMGMAASVEVRVPLLDHLLLELCARIPQTDRGPLLSGKAILRSAVKGWLPEDVVARPKFAFNATLLPLSRLLETSGASGEQVRELLSKTRIDKSGYFDFATVERLRLERNYVALDHVLNVQLFDDVFVSNFNPERFSDPPPLEAVLPLDRRQGKRAAQKNAATKNELTAKDVPRLHRSLNGVVGAYLFDTDKGALVQQKNRATFVEFGHEPVILSDDSLVVLELVNGERTFKDIVKELDGAVTLKALLTFAETLVSLGVLTVETSWRA